MFCFITLNRGDFLEKELFTVNQLAEMFEMHPKTIRRYIRNGVLKAVKIGGQWRVKKDDLKNFLDSNKDIFPNNQEKFNEAILEFINKKRKKEDGKIQILNVIDVFISNFDEGKKITSSLIKFTNSYRDEKIKPSIRYYYLAEENLIRFLIISDKKFLNYILKLLE